MPKQRTRLGTFGTPERSSAIPSKRRNHRRNSAAATAVTAILSVGLISGCATSPAKATNQAQTVLPVTVEKVRLQTKAYGNIYLGQITPYIQTSLSPGGSGSIAKLNVRAGEQVKAGEVICTLNPTSLVQPKNQVDAQSVALSNAQTAYDDALAMYHDRTSAKQQVANAQAALKQQEAALQAAKVNYQKAQLQEQTSVAAIQTDQGALAAAQKSLQVAKDNEGILKQAFDTAEAQYGNITEQQVQDAYQAYQTALARYQGWQQSGVYPGTNPFATQLQSTNTVYSALNQGYNALQTARQQYNSAQQGVASANAQVQQAQTNLLSVQNSGQVANTTNDTVAAAQAQLGLESAKASLNQAQAAYNAAVTSLQLAKQIANDRTQAKQQLDSAASNLASEKVALQTARSTLQAAITNNEVISPISGVVQAVNAEVGQEVGPQSNLVTIATTSPQVATVNVPEGDVTKISKGTKMTVTVVSSGKQLQGTVLSVHPQLSQTTNEYPVDIELTDAQTTLLPGIQVQAQLATQDTKQVILVPADAVLSLQSGAQEVFVEKNDVVHSQIVQVGSMSSSQYEITSGLKVGEDIVVKGQNLLSDGDKVKLVTASGQSASGK